MTQEVKVHDNNKGFEWSMPVGPYEFLSPEQITSFDENDTQTAAATTSSLDVSENPSERISSFNGQTFVLEYLAPRRSCRVNVVITAFANGRYYLFVRLKKAVDNKNRHIY